MWVAVSPPGDLPDLCTAGGFSTTGKPHKLCISLYKLNSTVWKFLNSRHCFLDESCLKLLRNNLPP